MCVTEREGVKEGEGEEGRIDREVKGGERRRSAGGGGMSAEMEGA